MLGTFGRIATQLDATERAHAGIGADLPVLVCKVYIHKSAPLTTHGMLLVEGEYGPNRCGCGLWWTLLIKRLSA
ncbi:hypothetical protein HNQ08_004317 [Deinococcus humi]|uniref:Uncharacterized protein n=1 Tax=Deinococcus humi TaxID=662880 RepID=A0A7W8JXS5_9DEIO|nr:hypothetical protein [Deinococcus humi]GGO35584.1 hypothetical protein GCM10008949_38270 [Deinococcus humi]